MWAIGNMFAIIAVLNIGIGKAYPLAELCGIVNALFAIFVLKEIQDKQKIRLFLLATLVSFS
jgi:glucose uptake protein GlcU